MTIKVIPLHCNRCGNDWVYQGKKNPDKVKYSLYTSCSKCHTTIKLPRTEKK